MKLSSDRVWVSILTRDEASADGAVGRLAALGGEVTARYKWALDSWVPVTSLEVLDGLEGMTLIHRPTPPAARPATAAVERPWLKAGSIVTQGVGASNADLWHAAGHTGEGIAVAFIDSFADYELAALAGELPADRLFEFGTLNRSDVHGTACIEIVHDMAPGASITMASSSTYAEFAQTVVALAEAGHQVIASSQAPVEPGPGDGTGVLADAIATARNLYGVTYVQSAGNQARKHWEGTFTDSDGDGWHDFDGTQVLPLTTPLQNEDVIQVLLSWDDWPYSDQDFNLYVVFWNGLGWQVDGGSENVQDGSQAPWEDHQHRILPGMRYGIAVHKAAATRDVFLDLIIHGGHPDLEQPITARSLDDIAAAPDAISVAAVDHATYSIEDFSSRGPTYGPGGVPSGGHDQPRIAAYDRVDTWSWPQGPFKGTSAACPHVAGAAALVLDAFPAYSPGQVQSLLEGRAIDGGSAGYDHTYGHGRLWLGDPPGGSPSCTYTISPSSANFGASGGSSTVNVDASSSSCAWNATTSQSWITITSGSSGTGDGAVHYTVAANSGGSRTGLVRVEGHTHSVTQDGSGSGQVDFTVSNSTPDIGESVRFEVSSQYTPVRWSMGGASCGGPDTIIDCLGFPEICRTVTWDYATAGGKTVTLTAEEGAATRTLTVQSQGQCEGCDRDGPPTADFTMAPNPNGIRLAILPVRLADRTDCGRRRAHAGCFEWCCRFWRFFSFEGRHLGSGLRDCRG